MDDAIISFDNLRIGYQGRALLDDISLAIEAGSFTSILGTNGSGKSTMLKTLLGLIPPLSGGIRLRMNGAGAPVFGYVPQSMELDGLYPLTGFDVAVMGSYGRTRPGRRVSGLERAFVKQCLAAAGADGFAEGRFAELSGGQKQRVLIARALVTRPDVLVLDEPTAGVDAAATNAVLEFIAAVHKEKRITVILVTHDLSLVRLHSQYVIWLHRGKILHGATADMLTPERMAEIFEMEAV